MHGPRQTESRHVWVAFKVEAGAPELLLTSKSMLHSLSPYKQWPHRHVWTLLAPWFVDLTVQKRWYTRCTCQRLCKQLTPAYSCAYTKAVRDSQTSHSVHFPRWRNFVKPRAVEYCRSGTAVSAAALHMGRSSLHTHSTVAVSLVACAWGGPFCSAHNNCCLEIANLTANLQLYPALCS